MKKAFAHDNVNGFLCCWYESRWSGERLVPRVAGCWFAHGFESKAVVMICCTRMVCGYGYFDR